MPPGTKLRRNSDQARQEEAERGMAAVRYDQSKGGRAVDIWVNGSIGENCRVLARCQDGREHRLESDEPLQQATGAAMMYGLAQESRCPGWQRL